MLKSYKLRAKEFYRILESFECYTCKVDDLSIYKNGYRDKLVIRYTDIELICTESVLNYLNLLDDSDLMYTEWKQVVVRIDNETTCNRVQKEVTGLNAYCRVMKALQVDYKKEEIKNILESFDTEYNYDKKQVHMLPKTALNKIVKIENCTGYDINGAHNYFLTKMFPKAAHYFEELYATRKVHPDNKKIANYFVGFLNTADKKGNFNRYPMAYNWIVQNTTDLLNEAMNTAMGTDGIIQYANTDGFIIQNSAGIPNISDNLGDFKVEMQGTLYSYVDKNYWCIQYTNTKGEKVLKGNLLNSLRELVDLEKGIVVHYDKVLKVVNSELKYYEAVNVTVEEIK